MMQQIFQIAWSVPAALWLRLRFRYALHYGFCFGGLYILFA